MTTRLYRFLALLGRATAFTLLSFGLATPRAAEPAENTTGKIRAGDRLYIHVSDSLPEQPIKGIYRVEPSGKVPLGPAYGRVRVAGLPLEDAEEEVQKHLKRILARCDVTITWYDPVAHGGPTLEERMARLEKQIEELRDAVEKLRKP